MLIRYGKDKKGKRVPIAHVYLSKEHGIPKKSIDKRAYNIITRLQQFGFEAYLVGGAVRDLLLKQTPKDFDIATSARPEEVRKIFRNSRIIGHRFKLVHVYFGSTNIEVATFRSKDSGNHKNEYGTIEEDALRRDFSVNALYYDPVKEQVLDYVGAMADVESKQIRSVIPLDTTFKEDPIRMLRAVKYSVTTGFSIPKKEAKQIRSQRKLLKSISSSRMTEEVLKILGNPSVVEIFDATMEYGLLPYILPRIEKHLRSQNSEVKTALRELAEREEPSRWRMLYQLTKSTILMPHTVEPKEPSEVRKDVYAQIKAIIEPITPPNVDVEKATIQILKDHGYPVGSKRKRKSSSRRNKSSS